MRTEELIEVAPLEEVVDKMVDLIPGDTDGATVLVTCAALLAAVTLDMCKQDREKTINAIGLAMRYISKMIDHNTVSKEERARAN